MPGGEAGFSKERTAGGRGAVSVHTGCFHVQKNCKPDEEQTWPLSFRERDGNRCFGKKDKTRHLVYNSCSEV